MIFTLTTINLPQFDTLSPLGIQSRSKKSVVVSGIVLARAAGAGRFRDRFTQLLGRVGHTAAPANPTRPRLTWSVVVRCAMEHRPSKQRFPKSGVRLVIYPRRVRTFEALIEAIAEALAAFEPAECMNVLANSGYRYKP